MDRATRWLEKDSKLSPREIDEIFYAFALPVVLCTFKHASDPRVRTSARELSALHSLDVGILAAGVYNTSSRSDRDGLQGSMQAAKS
jgi:hypothetical protein